MPSFKPFSQVTGRSNVSLFEIRLDNDFIVFRGSDHESAGQTLKGSVVLCLSSPLKVEDVHLRLTGELRFTWDVSKSAASGLSTSKVDKHTELLRHRWQPFVKSNNGDKTVLDAGNYEWPFKIDLPGDTCESIEGIPEASIIYRLKATIARGKLSHDVTAYKPLRIVRTLDPSALEFLHAMSVENIWPNKIDYSIVIPQKAVIFGSSIPLEMRFTPLLKGLEMGDISVKLLEIRECFTPGLPHKEHKQEREVTKWSYQVSREEHWNDMIGETGQEGWTVAHSLALPKRLKQCVQDVNHHGIKIRHKLKLVVGLKNPDGHVSELRATLPVSIFISPNMPIDETGSIIESTTATGASASDATTIAPPGYGEHVLDQLFEDVDNSGFQTPGFASGVNSPFYALSRAGSTENLAALGMTSAMSGVPPTALSARLANVSIDSSDRHHAHGDHSAPPTSHPSLPASTPLTRQNSAEEGRHSSDNSTPNLANHLRSGRVSPEHIEAIDLNALSKVPSYSTAIKTPARSRSQTMTESLPDYLSALSAPTTPMPLESPAIDPLDVIIEGQVQDAVPAQSRTTPSSPSSSLPRTNSLQSLLSRSPRSGGVTPAQSLEERRLHLIQARDRIY